MARIRIYLSDRIEARARGAARNQSVPVSHSVAEQATNKLAATWPAAVLEAFGAVPEFPEAEELRRGYGEDVCREPLF
jgi:hypothetical protein